MNAWSESEQPGRGRGYGGDWSGSRPSIDDPMSWAFPIMRVAGIRVRVHLFFVAFALAMIAHAASSTGDSPILLEPTLLGLAALFAVILLHEFGHCVACRMVGGRADEILLWPLGGLASCAPPERPRAHLWTALGGPLVNVVLIAILTPLIGVRTGQWLGLAVPNPLDLDGMIRSRDFGGSVFGGVAGGWADLLVILLNYISWTLLLFNLIPMFPLDGGRIVQAILWKRHGYARSMRLACRSGLFGAVFVGIGGLAMNSTTLLAIALFGGVVCYATARQVEQDRDYLGFEPDPSELAAIEEEFEDTPRRTVDRSVQGRDAPVAKRDVDSEIDVILDKIARHGIGSLTPAERDALARATERKRDGEKPNGGRA